VAQQHKGLPWCHRSCFGLLADQEKVCSCLGEQACYCKPGVIELLLALRLLQQTQLQLPDESTDLKSCRQPYMGVDQDLERNC
jgi:hypothetical protein